MNYTSLHHRPEVPDCRRTLSGQGRIFVCRLLLRVIPMIGIRVVIITTIVGVIQIVIVIVIVHSHSPTGETYRNNNIVANTAKAVKGVAQKTKKLNGNATAKKIKSNFTKFLQFNPTSVAYFAAVYNSFWACAFVHFVAPVFISYYLYRHFTE